MSDVPVPVQVKPGAANQQKQLIMLAVLGLVFLLAMVFFVLKPFGGDSGSSTTPVTTPPVSAPADGASGVTTSGGDAGASAETADTTPVERPARNPFQGP